MRGSRKQAERVARVGHQTGRRGVCVRGRGGNKDEMRIPALLDVDAAIGEAVDAGLKDLI